LLFVEIEGEPNFRSKFGEKEVDWDGYMKAEEGEKEKKK
jgi:hypothetical protein